MSILDTWKSQNLEVQTLRSLKGVHFKDQIKGAICFFLRLQPSIGTTLQ